jgi:hypothetical protein
MSTGTLKIKRTKNRHLIALLEERVEQLERQVAEPQIGKQITQPNQGWLWHVMPSYNDQAFTKPFPYDITITFADGVSRVSI